MPSPVEAGQKEDTMMIAHLHQCPRCSVQVACDDAECSLDTHTFCPACERDEAEPDYTDGAEDAVTWIGGAPLLGGTV